MLSVHRLAAALVIAVTVMFLQTLSVHAAVADPPAAQAADDRYEDDRYECTKETKLTEAQKQKLDVLLANLYTANKQLMEAYKENGMLEERQMQHKLKSLEHYLDKVKSRNYKWCSEFDDDEMEYDD